MYFDFPRSLAEHSYQSYLKYLEEKLTHEVKKDDCIRHVQKRLGTSYVVIKLNDMVQFYLMAKVLAVRTFNRPNNIPYACGSIRVCYRNNKGDQVSFIAAIGAIYHHMIMGPPEESIEHGDFSHDLRKR